jgi:uncharacterized protein YacL
MERKEKDFIECKKLMKKSQLTFFGTYIPLVVGGIGVIISFIIGLVVEKGKLTALHYWVFAVFIIVCLLVNLYFSDKHKKASDALATMFKKNIAELKE